MFTVLWCYLRNNAFKTEQADYHVSADLTGQANHLGVTIEADIIKQKLPENNGGYNAFSGYGKTSKLVYEELTTDHPIDLCRWQVANCYMGRIGLINSGGESKGAGDLADAVRTAVINKRAGGQGLISGRKAFQRPMGEGVELLHADPGRVPGQHRHPRLTRAVWPHGGWSSVTPTDASCGEMSGAGTPATLRCACTRSVAGRPRWGTGDDRGRGVGRPGAGVLRLTWSQVYVR